MSVERFIHFGEGLFETLRWQEGKFFTPLEYHYQRLQSGASFFEIPYPTFEVFKKFLEKHLKEFKNQPKPFYVKFLLLSLGEGYYGGKATDYRLKVVIKPFNPPKGKLTLTISPFRKCSANPLWRFKTTNFLFNVKVKKEALKRGFYDALVLNEFERITETSSANFYCQKDGVLLTPPTEEGLLEGVYRRLLLEQGKAFQHPLRLEDLKTCERFFISNSLLGLREVSFEE